MSHFECFLTRFKMAFTANCNKFSLCHCVVGIATISNQQTLPLPSLHTMTSGSKERIIETRFSLPSNVFLHPSLSSQSSSTSSNQNPQNMKYATLGRIRKNTGYNKGKRQKYSKLSNISIVEETCLCI